MTTGVLLFGMIIVILIGVETKSKPLEDSVNEDVPVDNINIPTFAPE